MIYERLLRPVFFRADPERVHNFFTNVGETIGKSRLARGLVRAFCAYRHPALRTEVLGIRFENPIGLAAGFDKDVRLTGIIPDVGFGFMEAGAVTRHPYEGNKGLRLLRLPADQSLIVYLGLKGVGADVVFEKLRMRRISAWRIPTGLNIAKTNRADIKGEKSIEDYLGTYRMLAPYFSYVTLNVSCPNAQDGCMFQDPRMLDELLAAFANEKKTCPIFLKVSSHLTPGEIDGVLSVTAKYPFVDGFVIANLHKKREALSLKSPKERLGKLPEGGISGAPIRAITTEMIRYVHRNTKGKYRIIGLGGVFNAEDAYEKIKAGASLVQIITGLIYGGPTVVRRINKGLVALLRRDGFKTIREAVGSGL